VRNGGPRQTIYRESIRGNKQTKGVRNRIQGGRAGEIGEGLGPIRRGAKVEHCQGQKNNLDMRRDMGLQGNRLASKLEYWSQEPGGKTTEGHSLSDLRLSVGVGFHQWGLDPEWLAKV